MDFLEVVGSRRSIRIFKPWAQVEKEKISTHSRGGPFDNLSGQPPAVASHCG